MIATPRFPRDFYGSLDISQIKKEKGRSSIHGNRLGQERKGCDLMESQQNLLTVLPRSRPCLWTFLLRRGLGCARPHTWWFRRPLRPPPRDKLNFNRSRLNKQRTSNKTCPGKCFKGEREGPPPESNLAFGGICFISSRKQKKIPRLV